MTPNELLTHQVDAALAVLAQTLGRTDLQDAAEKFLTALLSIPPAKADLTEPESVAEKMASIRCKAAPKGWSNRDSDGFEILAFMEDENGHIGIPPSRGFAAILRGHGGVVLGKSYWPNGTTDSGVGGNLVPIVDPSQPEKTNDETYEGTRVIDVSALLIEVQESRETIKKLRAELQAAVDGKKGGDSNG